MMPHLDFVVGGQMLGQAIVAGQRADPAKQVRSIQAVFASAGRASQPLDIDVETMHKGRSLTSATVTLQQSGHVVLRALVLLDVGEPDVIRYSARFPDFPGPDSASDVAPGRSGALDPESGSQTRMVGNVDLTSAAVGPAEAGAWVRWKVRSDEQTIHRALSAYYTNALLIGTAMRPHAGISHMEAHESLSTGVLSHTIVYHERIDAAKWHLFALQTIHAGAGRSYGRGDMLTENGDVVASFGQVNMIRRMKEGGML